MNPLMKAFYLYFYRDDKQDYEMMSKYLGYKVNSRKSLEHLFRTADAQDFVQKHTVFGTGLYFRYLEVKSKDAREEWGREAIYHTRNIRNVKRKK